MKPSLYRNPARKKAMQRPEQMLQIAIFNQLKPLMAVQKCQKFCAFHVPNGGYRTPAEAQAFFSMGTRSGVADIILLLPPDPDVIGGTGRTVFVELKAFKPPKTKPDKKPDTAKLQSETQADFMGIVQTLGFDYHVLAAKDAADACNQMAAILQRYGVVA